MIHNAFWLQNARRISNRNYNHEFLVFIYSIDYSIVFYKKLPIADISISAHFSGSSTVWHLIQAKYSDLYLVY
nr:MAG TPA: hypothetical protein [Caudoviricetes sp.]